jgi:hypothetical protein
VTFVKLQPGERAVILEPHQQALVLNDRWHFKISGIEDVFRVDTLIDGRHVTWCEMGQEWVEVWEPQGTFVISEES